MNEDHDFELWLQRELAVKKEYLEDRGFADSVLAKLAVKRKQAHAAFILVTILCALLAGGYGLLLFPGWEWAYTLGTSLPALSLNSLLQIALLFSLATGSIAIFILRREF